MTRRGTMTGSPLAALLALSGAVAVMAGAYGAHGATGKAAEWLTTGAHYQMIHAVAGLVALGKGRGPAALFLLGALLFSGTLYAMAFGGPRWLGAVTPLGGLALILGWMWLAIVFLRGR
ncbi:membrane protein [Sphingomonas sp. SRS2]|nr:membrane protein [Sphingomonas sp. SRS2]